MSFRFSLFAVPLLLGLMAAGGAAWAAGDSPAAPEGDAAAADATVTQRTYVTNGATITWNLDRKAYESPSAEQAAELAAAMREMMSEKAAAGKSPLAVESKVETLPSGIKRARATVDMLNLSLVRVASDGELEAVCVDGPTEARDVLAAPVDERGEDR